MLISSLSAAQFIVADLGVNTIGLVLDGQCPSHRSTSCSSGPLDDVSGSAAPAMPRSFALPRRRRACVLRTAEPDGLHGPARWVVASNRRKSPVRYSCNSCRLQLLLSIGSAPVLEFLGQGGSWRGPAILAAPPDQVRKTPVLPIRNREPPLRCPGARRPPRRTRRSRACRPDRGSSAPGRAPGCRRP